MVGSSRAGEKTETLAYDLYRAAASEVSGSALARHERVHAPEVDVTRLP